MSISETTNAALKQQFAAAWRFLKTQRADLSKQAPYLIELPWYLVIGPAGAGKTQFIMQNPFALIEASHLNNRPQDEGEGSHRCNWWFTRQLTFIDVPGHDLTTTSATPDAALATLLDCLQTYTTRKPLNGIILILDLAELSLLGKSAQKHYVQVLNQNLLTLKATLSLTCPIFILLNKIDRLAGFNEFFTDLGQEERAQIFGINLAQAPKARASSLPRLFKSQFDLLISRLQGRVVWRLHHERNLAKRALITQFPLQLEQLGTKLANVLYHLADTVNLNDKLPLQGLYFTSNFQQGLPIDLLRSPTAGQDHALQKNIVALATPFKQQAYFSRQLLHNLVSTTAVLRGASPRLQRYDKKRWLAYLCAATVIIGGGLLLAAQFKQRLAQLNAAQTALTHYNVLENQLENHAPDLGQSLQLLNTLQQVTQIINAEPLSAFSTHARQLPPLAHKTYHTRLLTYLLPNLKSLLEHTLLTNTDAEFNYSALQAYLMLGEPNHLNARWLKNWFANYWRDLFPQNPALQAQLNQHLAALLTQGFAPIQLESTVLLKARANLNALAPGQLAYILLKAQTASTMFNPFSKNVTQASALKTIFKNSNASISTLYTQAAFKEVYLNQSKLACARLLNNDWVLGAANARSAMTAADLTGLTQQVRLLYLQDYAQKWQTLLNNLQLSPQQNWQAVQAILAQFLSSQSLFVRIIKTVGDNTNLALLTQAAPEFSNDDLQSINTELVSHFSAFDNYLRQPDAHGYTSLNNTLGDFKALQNLLLPAADTRMHNKAAFDAAKALFDASENNPIATLFQLANVAPVPVQNWLRTLADNSLQLILVNATDYIDWNWQQQIVPYYLTHLDNRYPLNKAAANDIELIDFKYFFAGNGLLNNFVTHYLAPFIDSAQTQWQWRTLNGETLKFNNNLLPQLERAAIIRTMYFDELDALNVPFLLTANTFGPAVKTVALQASFGNFSDSAGQQLVHTLTWPGSGSSALNLTFTDNNNRQVTTTLPGAWALFRLLDKSNLQKTNDTQHYSLVFDANGQAAHYTLAIDKVINPFIDGVVEQFACSPTLQ